jgi:hypothetical protein
MKTDLTQDETKKDLPENSESLVAKNLVENLFKSVKENNLVAENIRLILARLYIPYLKFAQDTPNLFAIENHQARIFLSNAMKNSKEWKKEHDSNNSYIKKIESVVETIVRLERYDSNVFVKLGTDLEKQMSRINKRLNIKLKRKQETQLGQDKILQAQKNTKDILTQKLKGKKIPNYIKELLLTEWFNVLVLLNIRHSLTSIEYLNKLDFADQLIEKSQPNPDKKFNEKQFNDLVNEYKKGLILIAFNPLECDKKQQILLKSLLKINRSTKKVVEKANENVVKKPVEKPVEKNVEKTPPIIIEKTLTKEGKTNNNIPMQTKEILGLSQFKKKSKPNLHKKPTINTVANLEPESPSKKNVQDYNEIVTNLQKGTWFIFLDNEKEKVKAKLSWISPISGKYLFVDANGLKLTDKTKLELVSDLQDESIQILNTFN